MATTILIHPFPAATTTTIYPSSIASTLLLLLLLGYTPPPPHFHLLLSSTAHQVTTKKDPPQNPHPWACTHNSLQPKSILRLPPCSSLHETAFTIFSNIENKLNTRLPDDTHLRGHSVRNDWRRLRWLGQASVGSVIDHFLCTSQSTFSY
ncbi:hypothetical protein BDQ94DRAFT_136939 [Aspergillus welwitschiae]|uniref:Uncharacterized protein n=1 Tax=Aspergillus welwitschiae TaxID=1341132 RepID=A0A3F3QC95_9EURO|nr:hypothetical protein BDQ94DRAFT_136939 [Aspergillus welwitschiae]RDH36821.1 hypothetical protein BDQ94DRAFT_136939 [Aspergillus welwitschiae]